MIGEVGHDLSAKRAEYTKRSRVYDEETFEKALQETREQQGWTIQRENKTTLRMRRPKRFDEVLENRFWNILYRFGYSDLNIGRSFKVVVGKGSEATTKQIDVFAKDDETVVIAECKACETPTKRSLLKDLNELAGLMKPIAGRCPVQRISKALIICSPQSFSAKPYDLAILGFELAEIIFEQRASRSTELPPANGPMFISKPAGASQMREMLDVICPNVAIACQ